MKTISYLKIFCLLSVFILTLAVNADAQDRQKGQKGNGKITGKVIDKETSAPIESATIQLFKQKDSSLVTGMGTASDGTFTLDAPYGKYKLVVSYISYSSAVYNGIALNSQNPNHDVGTVNLSSNMTTTEVIEVEAEQDFMEVGTDKKVFNVEKSLVSEGGTATDVLKNIPAVTVDADGNVSLRGSSNIKFLVNGKPSGMIGNDPTNSLQQIPASTIDRIEVIDNPSAKYDPDGMSGIINIVMKKTEEAGYNGNFTVNGGTADKYNTGLNFNYKNKNLNVYGSYNYRLFNMSGNATTFRQNIFGDTSFYFDQNSNQHFNMQGHMGTFGLDYSLDKLNTLSLSATYNNRKRSIDQTIFFRNLDEFQNLTSQYIRNNDESHKGEAVDFNLGFTHKFSKPKEELSAVLYYSSTTDNQVLNSNQQNYSPLGSALGNPILQNTFTDGKYYVGSFQVDYYHPLGDDLKSDSRIELGYKGLLRNTSSNFREENYDTLLNSFVTDALMNNNFEYKEQIHSFYGLYANNFKDFKYQVGLRLEEALTNPNLITTGEDYKNNYFSFFPSVYLSQRFAESNEIQLNYSRRINRPTLQMLNPFVDYSDPYNLRKGNPFLQPEYVNSIQMNYVKYFDFATVTSSVFYRLINNMMTRISTVYPDGTSMTTFENLNSAKSYGLELTTISHPFSWWNVNADFTYFRTIINGNDPNAALNNDNYSYTAKMTSNFTLKNLFDIQVSYNYQGPTYLAQGRQDPVQSFDFAIKKNILDNKGSIGLRVADVFNQQKYSSETSGTGFIQDMTRVRDSRMAFLTFSYRFGSDGSHPNKKVKQKQQEDDSNDNMDN